MRNNRSLLLMLALLALAGAAACGPAPEVTEVDGAPPGEEAAAAKAGRGEGTCGADADCAFGTVCQKPIGQDSGACVDGCHTDAQCQFGGWCQVPLICVGYQEPCIGQCVFF